MKKMANQKNDKNILENKIKFFLGEKTND